MAYFFMVLFFSAGTSFLIARRTKYHFSLVFLAALLMFSSLTIRKLHKIEESQAASQFDARFE